MTAEALVVLGCGARTPLGFDRAASAAAVRCGISAIAEHPFMIDRFGQPMLVTRDAGVDPALSGPARLAAIAAPAARAALAPLLAVVAEPEVAVAVSLGEARPGQAESTGDALGTALGEALGADLPPLRVRPWMGGHAGGIVAMHAAQRLIADGKADFALAGGVDSYLEPETLEWLDETEQLHSEDNIYGFCPGEAAGFVLLARAGTARRLGIAPLAELRAVGTGIETNLIKTEDICLGEGLADAFRAAAAPLAEGETVDRILCDMNGERYRGNEFGFAVLKTPGRFRDAAAFETPADCWGDVGAASGPLYACLAVEAAARGYAPGPYTLIWASSEGGQRGAALLRKPEGA